ncbi:unnamed protein product, partial [Caretta caretta]
MITKHTERLEAKVRNIKVYGSSFHCLKPRSWISDEKAWRTTAYTATLSTVKRKVRIARWSSVILASIPCITEGTNQDYL